MKYLPRRRWARWSLEAALVLAVYLAVRAYQHREVADGAAPPIQATTIDGAPVSLADFRGQTVLLRFWASWCSVCKLEDGNVGALAQRAPTLTVATRSGDPAELRRIASQRGLRYPIIADPDGELAERYGVTALPTSFVLGPEGEIRFTEVGYTTELGMRLRVWLASM